MIPTQPMEPVRCPKDFTPRRRRFVRIRIAATALLAWLMLQAYPSAEARDTEGKAAKAAEDIILSDSNWRLEGFPFDEGERQGVYKPDFDDTSFKEVTVPGEVQLQVGLTGMRLYEQSKELSLLNQREWWYRKRFNLPKADSGKLLRLVFDGG